MNNNIHKNEIASMNKNNISNNYQNNENENPVTIDKYIIESFQDKINKTNCKLNKLLKCLNEIDKKNNNIQKIIKEYLQIMSFDNTYYENYQKYMKIITQYLNVNYDNQGNENDKNVNKNSLGEKTGENYKYTMKNIFLEKKLFNNKNLSKIDQKSKINTNEQNLKFNSNVHTFEFKYDSLAEKSLGCTTTDK